MINDQVKIYGRTREAITEAIRICKNRNILKDYLTSREKEVVDIMITLFDQREVLEDYIASERREAAEMSAQRAAKKMHAKHMPVEDIADVVGYSVETVEKWLGLVPQAQISGIPVISYQFCTKILKIYADLCRVFAG